VWGFGNLWSADWLWYFVRSGYTVANLPSNRIKSKQEVFLDVAHPVHVGQVRDDTWRRLPQSSRQWYVCRSDNGKADWWSGSWLQHDVSGYEHGWSTVADDEPSRLCMSLSVSVSVCLSVCLFVSVCGLQFKSYRRSFPSNLEHFAVLRLTQPPTLMRIKTAKRIKCWKCWCWCSC